MSLLRIEKHRNGDGFTPVEYYTCDGCQGETCEMYPHHVGVDPNTHYCWDCAFILGFNDEKRYLDYAPFGGMTNIRAAVRNGKIVTWTSKTPPWEMTNKDHRNSNKYKRWRTSVFERDGCTCQDCNQVGGNLEAHHIKPFATYKSLRYTKSNGVTLCKKCHRSRHRRLKKEGVKYG